MTLSKWFRDYLYIPLGGSRSGYKRTILNLFVVWALTGLWHGANWTFVMWGLIYFALLVFEKYFKQIRRKSIEDILPRAVSRIYTIFFVVIAWIFFRSESVGAAFEYLKGIVDFTNVGMVKWQAIYYIKEFAIFYLAAVLSAFGIIEMVKAKLDANSSIYIIGRDILLVILFLMSFMYIIKGSFNPFIYFNF
jgi:alginate O-acetyltransferase